MRFLEPKDFGQPDNLKGITDWLPESKQEWKKVGIVAGIVAAIFTYWMAKGKVKRTVKAAKKKLVGLKAGIKRRLSLK